MATSGVDRSAMLLKAADVLRKAVAGLFDLIFGNHDSDYDRLEDWEKTMFDNRYPEYVSRHKIIGLIRRIGQGFFSLFATAYLGIEFAPLLAISVASFFGYVSLALFVAGFVCMLATGIAQYFLVTRPRNQLLRDQKLNDAFKNIKTLRESAEKMNLKLTNVKKQFAELKAKYKALKDSDQFPESKKTLVIELCRACKLYIGEEKKLISKEAIHALEKMIIDCRVEFPEREAVLEAENAQFEYMTTIKDTVLADDLQPRKANRAKRPLTGDKPKTKSSIKPIDAASAELLLHDNKFARGWLKLKGKIPDVHDLNPKDNKDNYVQMISEINKLENGLILMDELHHSLEKLPTATPEKSPEPVEKVSFDESMLKRIRSEYQSRAAAEVEENQHSHSTKKSKRLIKKHWADVPCIVQEVLKNPEVASDTPKKASTPLLRRLLGPDKS